MKIGIQKSNYSPNFTSRKKEIRDADDIQRKSREIFPMVSPSRIASCHSCLKNNSKYSSRAQDIYKHKFEELMDMRDEQSSMEKCLKIVEPNLPYAGKLNIASRYKIGNCHESAMAAMATLCANGYYNSERASLGLENTFTDKKTGKTVYKIIVSMDHTFVITDMNDEGKRTIVIDPWLGFADSKSGALERYKKFYTDETINDAIEYAKHMFSINMRIKGHREDFDFNDYDVKSSMKLVPRGDADEITPEKLINLGNYARTAYSGIILDKKA